MLLLAAAGSLAARNFGPDIGSHFTAFNLPDQNGRMHGLRRLLGPKGAAILFYQSADWSPYCKAQLVELERNHDAFRQLGLGLAAVSYDSPAIAKDFAESESIHFPLLSDSGSKIIRALQIADEKGAARPGWFVLNARGVIVAKYFEDELSERYTSAAVLLHQFGWMPPGPTQRVEGKQLTVTAVASNVTVGPGQRVALALDIELGPNMHVYAPGVEGYIPIDWKMQDSSIAQVHAPAFPAAEKLYLKAIDETVPAYRGHFRITRDITIPPDNKIEPALDAAKRFAENGSLRYQACDDRVCYIPQELQLRWTFNYQPLNKTP